MTQNHRFFPAILSERTWADWVTLTSFFPILLGYIFIIAGKPDEAIFSFSIAFLLDMLDGYVARRLGTESAFGRYLDAFADFFNYVVGSTLFLLVFTFHDASIAVVASFFIIIAGALRLSRFNESGLHHDDKSTEVYYIGFPVPFISLITFSFYYFQTFLPSIVSQTILFISLIVISWLMISSIPVKKSLSSLWVIAVISFLCLSIRQILA